MRLGKHRGTPALAMNMTPMIDVVFQLLIFFLVSSHLAKQEGQLPIPLPRAATGEVPQATATEQPRVTLNVLVDGTLVLAGRVTTLDELPQRLARLRETEGPDVELRLRIDRAAPYSAIEPVLAQCARAGVWNVAFSVLPGLRDGS